MCPADAVASTWNVTPASLAIRPIGPTGSIVPISELACITERSAVSARSAFRTASGSTTPFRSTGRTVTSYPALRSGIKAFITEKCSTSETTTCRFPAPAPSAAPRTARLFDSVAPEVKTISPAFAPISAATSALAWSTARSAACPWLVDVGGRVAVPFEEVRTHRLEDAGVERGGRYMVEKGLRHRIVRAPRFTA